MLLWASAAVAQTGQLVFVGTPPQSGVARYSPTFAVQAQFLDGGPQVLSAALPVAVQSTSSGGRFSSTDSPFISWSGAFTVTIAAGSSTSGPLAYIDTASGAPTLSMDGGSSWLTVPLTLPINPLTTQDDFETGAISQWDGTTGPWSNAYGNTGYSLDAGSFAAHRGNYGVRVTDNSSTFVGSNQPCMVALDVPAGSPTLTFGPEVYTRAWYRIPASNGQGDIGLILIAPSMSIGFQPGLPAAYVGTGSGNLALPASVTGIFDGGWHLLEFAVVGNNSTDGGYRVWLDGVLQGAGQGIDLTGATASNSVGFGEPVSDDDHFMGLIDFDDARVGATPFASTLLLERDGGALRAGACEALAVQLRTSDAQPAVATYPVVVALDAGAAGGAFFADPACTQGSPDVTLPVDAGSAPVYFTPSRPGAASVTATQVDFLSQALTIQVSFADGGAALADGGLPGMDFAVGCTCQSTSPEGALALLVGIPALWLLRRKRNRHPDLQ